MRYTAVFEFKDEPHIKKSDTWLDGTLCVINFSDALAELEALQAKMKMTEQNKAMHQEFLFVTLGEIIDRIERCGASPELTNAVSLASDLRQAVGNQWNPSNAYAFERVKATLAPNAALTGRGLDAE